MSILYILEEYYVDTEMLASPPKHALRECGEKVFSTYSRDRLIQNCYVNPTILVGMCRNLEPEKA